VREVVPVERTIGAELIDERQVLDAPWRWW